MLELIVQVLLFVAFVAVMRRLLGVKHLSLTRTVLAGVTGLVAGAVVGGLLARRGMEVDVAGTTALVLGLVFAMAVIVGLEWMAEPRRGRRRGPRSPLARARRRVTQARRSLRLATIASRHGLRGGLGIAHAGDVSEEDAAAYGVELRAALEEAGGVFVKLGQVLSTRTDLVPEALARELEALQQDVEPVPRPDLERAFAAALGRPVDQVFAEFDWDPLGAASIGQVHAARLPSGTEVVVKVRRPEVSAVIEQDLELALDLAAALHARSRKAEQLDVVGVTEQFATQLRAELDYAVEAANTREAAATIPADAPIVVPEVVDELSGPSVLVMTRIPGTPLGRVDRVDPARGPELARALFRHELGAMMAGQRFHADPHPGNVLLMPDGRLGLIDFGSAGRLDTFERASVTDLFAALTLDDPTMLRSALLEVGSLPENLDPGQLDRALARLMADHLRPGATPSAALVQDFLRTATDFGLGLPPDMTQMMRALATLQGTLEVLDPDFALVDEARTVAIDDLQRELRPDNLAEEAKREAVTLAPILRRVPHHFDRIAGQVESGRLGVRVRLFAEEEDVRVVTRLVNRLVLVAVGAAFGVVSALLFAVSDGPELTADVTLYDLFGFLGLFAGATLLMRVVLEVLRDP